MKRILHHAYHVHLGKIYSGISQAKAATYPFFPCLMLWRIHNVWIVISKNASRKSMRIWFRERKKLAMQVYDYDYLKESQCGEMSGTIACKSIVFFWVREEKSRPVFSTASWKEEDGKNNKKVYTCKRVVVMLVVITLHYHFMIGFLCLIPLLRFMSSWNFTLFVMWCVLWTHVWTQYISLYFCCTLTNVSSLILYLQKTPFPVRLYTVHTPAFHIRKQIIYYVCIREHLRPFHDDT